MSWRHGDLLWLLTLVPVVIGLLVLRWRLRARATARFGDPATVAVLVAGRAAPWRAARAILWILAFAFFLLAMAGPQYGSRTRWLRQRGTDVVIALDFSKSMLAQDVRPSRIDRAKAELMRFLDELQGDRVGVVAFAGETMEFPMTIDHGAVGLFLRDMGPYDMPVGGTAIGRALIASQRLLERAERPADRAEDAEREEERGRVVVLLTDGEDHEGDPLEAADELADAGIQVYAVGIGSRSGEPVPTYSNDGTWTGYLRDEQGQVVTTAFTEEGEETLREVARRTDGHFVRARDGGVGLEEVRRRIRRLKQGERQSRQVTVHEDRYALALLPAFFLLLLEALLPEAFIGRKRRKKRPPAKKKPFVKRTGDA
tara:strand:+ start:1098 stop:2210 length:1113 start_codon:yes stop_codon:yes gene_type:complete